MGPGGVAALQGGASLVGGWLANRGRSKEAEKNRRFQERMRNTQWQAAVADMEAAGINPALAYSQGPNASPGGSMASQEDIVTPAVSSARQGAMVAKQMKQLDAQISNVQAQTSLTKAKARLESARADYLVPETQLSMDVPGRTGITVPPLLFDLIDAEIGGASARARKDRLTGDVMEPTAEIMRTLGVWGPILALLGGGLSRGLGGLGGRLLRGRGKKVRPAAVVRGGSRTPPEGVDYKAWLKSLGRHP